MKERIVLVLLFASLVLAVPAFSQAAAGAQTPGAPTPGPQTPGAQTPGPQGQSGPTQSPPAQNVAVGQPNPENIGKDQAQQLLQEVSVSKFEDSAFWGGSIPLDDGVIELKRLAGSPAGKQPIPEEAKLGIKEEDKYVLGVKVSFFHRGDSFFTVYPAEAAPHTGDRQDSLRLGGRQELQPPPEAPFHGLHGPGPGSHRRYSELCRMEETDSGNTANGRPAGLPLRSHQRDKNHGLPYRDGSVGHIWHLLRLFRRSSSGH